MKTASEVEKLVKENDDYKYALDQSCIVAITDQKGIILHVNDNFCRISKYAAEELIGQDHRIVNSSFHPKEFIRNLWVTIAHGKVWRGEIKNKAKDGTYYWVDTTIVPFLDKKGKPFQYIAIRADITARKRVEESLRLLNEELEERVRERTSALESFSYSVSHDLRAPLRAINGFSRILKEDYFNAMDDEANRLLDIITTSASKMNGLIDELLALSRLGRRAPEKTQVDMKKLAESVWNDLSRTAIAGTTIQINGLEPVFADEMLVYQVMTNLVSNAIKYSSKNPHPVIEIGCETREGNCIYYIKDNGVGFNMEYYARLFSVFQRLHGEKEFEGTGVGLAIVKSIVEKHGGRVWAEGVENKGAAFYFTLHGNN